MSTILWIIIFGFLMSCIALVGSLTLFLREETANKIILPLVAFSAGSLIGGAVFHMIPAAVDSMGNISVLYCWLMAGFMLFYALEEFLNWHHSHTHAHSCGPLSPPHQHHAHAEHMTCSDTFVCGLDSPVFPLDDDDTSASGTPQVATEADNVESGMTLEENSNHDENTLSTAPDENVSTQVGSRKQRKEKRPIGYLILVADAVHNLLGGLFVGASFVDSIELGVSAWVAAAAHEVPQELGDFAVLVHGGWSKRQALLFNFLSALTFPLGGIIAYVVSKAIDVAFLVPFAAGNFLYIGGSDLIPEVKHYHGAKRSALHFACFSIGVGLLLGIRIAVKGW